MAVALFSDRDAPEVLPITYVSLVFSLGSISLTLLSSVKFFKAGKIAFANQMEGFALNFCDIYFNAISTSLFIAVTGVSKLYIIACLWIVSIIAKSFEMCYLDRDSEERHRLTKFYMICFCCVAVLVTACYKRFLFRIVRYCIYLIVPVEFILSGRDFHQLESAFLIWSCVAAGIFTIAMDIHLTFTNQRFWSDGKRDRISQE